LKQRIDNLTGKVSIIKVGGKTENEMKERYDRYDDAVKAVACALEEGIVEGGGLALYNAGCELLNSNFGEIVDKIFDSIDAPFEQIKTNGAIFKDYDLYSINIIDPLKVTRTALENAVSVAKTILSTDAIVLNEIEWNKN
jgi:chaperonin GroEL